MYGNLSSRGYAKSVKGTFVIFIVKKKEKIRWRKLHSEGGSEVRLGSRGREASKGGIQVCRYRDGGCWLDFWDFCVFWILGCGV